MPGRALVTGAAGFTGSYLVKALHRKEYTVVGLGLGHQSAGDDWISCDLTNEAAVSAAIRHLDPEIVVHLAAISSVDHGREDDFYRTNVIGTLNLLRALSDGRIPRKVLVASSANVYGRSSGQPVTEDACPAPVNHYGASKLAMEHLARNWFDSLPVIISRPFNYTGPGQAESFVVPKLVAHYRARRPSVKLGNIDVERDFTDVNDLVEAYIRLLESDIRSETVNICTGKTVSISQIVEHLNRIAGYNIELRIDPLLVRSTDIPRLVGNNDKLRMLTGFVPSRSFVETLETMYHYPR